MALVGRLLFYHQTLRDLNRVINCERGVASVANCAYPLRYLASRFSLGLTQNALHYVDAHDSHLGEDATPHALQVMVR